MALLFATGFGLTTTNTDIFTGGVVDSGRVVIGAYGRNGGQGLRLNGPGGISAPLGVVNLGGNFGTLLIGVAVQPNAAPSGKGIFGFRDNGTLQAQMTIANDGTCAFTGTAATFMLDTSLYHYIEAKCVIHGSAGSWVVRLNGAEVLNVTGIDTQASTNATASQLVIGGTLNAGSQPYYDDLVVMDSVDATASQGAPFNDFLGDIRVDELLPDGAGDSTQWTPSAGSNFQCVDETPRNDDTDYVSSATVGNKDLYNYPNLASTSGAVKGILVIPRWRKDDAGTRTLKVKVKHGGTEGDGPSRGMTTSYTYDFGGVFGVNPSTGNPWTIAEVNTTQAGIEVVS